MLVTLVGKNSIYKIVLPQLAVGNYWICDDNGKKYVNIEGKNGTWQITSNNNFKIINPDCLSINDRFIRYKNNNKRVINNITLKEYNTYCMAIGKQEELYILYCLPVYDYNYIHLNISHPTKISIGRSIENDIVYNNVLVSNRHVQMIFNNGRWILENYDNRFGTFVNNTPVFKTTRVLLNGDVIFIMGMKIIIMGNTLYVNKSSKEVTYNPKSFSLFDEKDVQLNKEAEKKDDIELTLEQEYYSRAPRIINKIETEKIRIDPPPTKQDKDDLGAFLTIASTLSMGTMMMISMSNSISEITSGKAKDYIEDVIFGIQKNISDIDNKIEKNLKQEWKLERISKIDLSILRLAIYEIVYKEVPYKVAINEAVEISKKYGEDTSKKFVNGILASIVKEIQK